MNDFAQILFKKLELRLKYIEPIHLDSLRRAFNLAYQAHDGQMRRSGEPYITHPVAVACLLAGMKMDYQSVMAALLHDVIEDTSISYGMLEVQFGEVVAKLVDGVTKLTQIEFVTKAEAQAENFCKMVLAMANDIRVIIIKLADRLHNMRTMGAMPAHKAQRIANETLDIFAPLARRLGMRDIYVELEELSFLYLHPGRYKILKERIRKERGSRLEIFTMIEKKLNKGIRATNIKSVKLVGREKHLYSVYRKMRDRKIPFNEIMDVFGFRVIVTTTDQAYRMLGIVHAIFKPVPERFKDYIALPKANGYQSLHTTLFGP